MKAFDEKTKARFLKIIVLMNKGTLAGERQAAKQAATRLANAFDMTLEQAIAHCRNPNSFSQEQQKSRRDAYHYWAYTHSFATERRQRQNKQAWEHAKQAANARENYARAANNEAYKKEAPSNANATVRSGYIPRYRPSNYRQTPEDRLRLISGLLFDGASFKTTAELSDAAPEEVNQVWLMMRRGEIKKPSMRRMSRQFA